MDAIAGILYIGGAVGFLILILHLLDKYAGISTYSTPTQGASMINSARTTEKIVKMTKESNPELYSKAVASVERKNYARTYSNIHSEMNKITKNNPELKKPLKSSSTTYGKVIKTKEEKDIIKSIELLSEKIKTLENSVYFTLYNKKEKNNDEKELEQSNGYLQWKSNYELNQLEFRKAFHNYSDAAKKGSLKDVFENFQI